MEPLAFYCEQCGEESDHVMKIDRTYLYPNGEEETTELIPLVYIFSKCGHIVEEEPEIIFDESSEGTERNL